MKYLVRSDRFLSVALALLPALAVYEFLPGTSLGSFVMLAATVFVLLGKHDVKISRDELYLLIAVLIISFLSNGYHLVFKTNQWFDTSLFYHNLYNILVCFFPLVLVIRRADIKILIQTLLTIGVLASIVIIWQRLTLLTTGSFLQEVFLPGFEVTRDIETMTISRPSAFFTEPAHFCTFMLPVLYISLFAKYYLISALSLFAILCSGSTTGFILSAVVVAYAIYNSGSRHRVRLVVLSIILLFLGYFLIVAFYPQILLENMEKLAGVQEGDSDIRLLGPLQYLSFFDGFERFFGISLNQLKGFLKSFGLDRNNYANAVIFMLISFGVVGSTVFVLYLLKKWKSSFQNKGLFLIFVGILCTDQILFNAHFLYLASLTILSPRICGYISMLDKTGSVSKRRSVIFKKARL